MRKCAPLILLFSLCGGGAGFLLRKYQLMTAYEPLSGLPARGAQATILSNTLTLYFFLIVLAFAVFASLRYKTPADFENTFCVNAIIYPVVNVLIGGLLMCGAVMHLVNLRVAEILRTIDIYFVVILILAAASIILSAVELFQNPRHKFVYALSIAPIAFLCFWLIMLYRANAATPVLLEYVYPCLAIMFSTLSFHFTAGFLFGSPSSGKAIVAYCGTIYLCGAALAENFDTGIILIFCALIAYAAIHLFMLTRTLQRK